MRSGIGTAVEQYVSFPVHMLPSPMGKYVSICSKSIGCDEAYVALPLLSATASVIGNTRRLQLKPGWHEPCVLWTAIVGESGTMKTPAFCIALRQLRDLQRDELRRHDDRLADHRDALMRYGKQLRTWKSATEDPSEPPTKPGEPQPWRYIISDTTVEALAPILKANWRGVLLARDELSGWIGSFDRYTGGKGADAAHWLSMFSAETLIVDRKTGKNRTIMIENAAVSVTGGIQPGILRRVIGDVHRDNGLLARLLMACPPRRPKKWTEVGIKPEEEAWIGSLYDRLRELRPNKYGDQTEPAIVRLTPDGRAAWSRFYDAHSEEQAALSGYLSSAWSKLEGYAARLALVIHFVRWAANDSRLDSPEYVDEDSIQAGIALSRWFGREARRVYGMLGESEADGKRRQLVEWIEYHGGSVTVRDLTHGRREFRSDSKAARAALDELSEAGFGKWFHSSTGSRGGRPSRRFKLVTESVVSNTRNDTSTDAGFGDGDNEGVSDG